MTIMTKEVLTQITFDVVTETSEQSKANILAIVWGKGCNQKKITILIQISTFSIIIGAEAAYIWAPQSS